MTDPRFPVLTQKQIATLRGFADLITFEEETAVFRVGDSAYDFYVVLQGAIHIKDPFNENQVLATHGINEFTGDNSMLSERSIPFDAYASKGSTVLRITPTRLKEVIAKHSDICDVLLSAFIQRQETMLRDFNGGIQVIGSEKSRDTYALRDFMEKNHIWHTFHNTDASGHARQLLESFSLSDDDLPILINITGEIVKKPTIAELARETGVLSDFGDEIYDVLVVGAGPSGLAASVYAASEGLSVVTIDGNAPGGQAGKSSKIENYLGFPTGISGNDLANKAYIQAQKFGCILSIPQKAEKVEYNGDHFSVCVSNGKNINARAVIAATGAEYRRLPINTIDHFEGSGVFYSATAMNASACKNELVGVVGGGNSAGQAALFLADHAHEVHIIIRAEDLGAKMSDYLVQRIYTTPNIIVHTKSSVTALNGMHHLESVVLDTAGEKQRIGISNLFTFIGAKPCTDWLSSLIAMDDKGFIYTGPDVTDNLQGQCALYRHRKPQSLETSISGFFAVGDVRKGSVKRVASAVGEGSMAISQIHQYLAELKIAKRQAPFSTNTTEL
ncbi:cyclic nucleotide-binding domain-containing protein [Flavobacterium alkalisoli]|uniref:Cyclic nucleotide-binding domain-containing protein n=1 Tax=Flavobacterium alkalisoli TaxID=2602769 RepID=A0A5B9FVS8_9FLAO|nr:cyclic nucleotide-binding domain-containing thioredoxin-disulfide reductase [Flavobacterium alkalisoli]QEE50271.1 cyclic nucleotide-binding domain-containing protein [Flavobacterium alkalisoli]